MLPLTDNRWLGTAVRAGRRGSTAQRRALHPRNPTVEVQGELPGLLRPFRVDSASQRKVDELCDRQARMRNHARQVFLLQVAFGESTGVQKTEIMFYQCSLCISFQDIHRGCIHL